MNFVRDRLLPGSYVYFDESEINRYRGDENYNYDARFDKKLFADFGINFQRREYRLRDNAALIDRMVAIELGATYRFCPNFALRGFVGAGVNRNVGTRFRGNKVTDQDVDSGAILGVRALFTF